MEHYLNNEEIKDFISKKYKSVKIESLDNDFNFGYNTLKIKVNECKTDFRNVLTAIFNKYPTIIWIEVGEGNVYTRNSLKNAGFNIKTQLKLCED